MATINVPFLNPMFKTAPLPLDVLALCSAAVAVVWVVFELEKASRRIQFGSTTNDAVNTP